MIILAEINWKVSIHGIKNKTLFVNLHKRKYLIIWIRVYCRKCGIAQTLKYGESIDPQKRYSQAELDRYNADMYIQVQGSKREIHNWQHEKILDYMYVTDQHPLLNKSLW